MDFRDVTSVSLHNGFAMRRTHYVPQQLSAMVIDEVIIDCIWIPQTYHRSGDVCHVTLPRMQLHDIPIIHIVFLRGTDLHRRVDVEPAIAFVSNDRQRTQIGIMPHLCKRMRTWETVVPIVKTYVNDLENISRK